MALRRRPKPISREQSLRSVPLRNTVITVERTDQGHVRLVVPRKETWWVRILSRVFYIPKRRPLTLDEVGSFVWDLCDGKNNVRQIIRALCQRYTLHRKEAEVSVVAYLRQLAKRGLIGIALLKEAEKGPGGKQD